MTEFGRSRWADPDFTKEYRENADIYIVERGRMFGIMRSFYRHFISDAGRKCILDLGCGDGVVTHNLLSLDNDISATLVDPSAYMLDKARERFSDSDNITYVQASFQDLLQHDRIQHDYNFIVSSQAIHHLSTKEKKRLFVFILSHLKTGGYFMNIDVTLAPSENLEDWYMQLWNEWMNDRKADLGIDRDLFKDIIRRYKKADENRPDTLEEQLNALSETGFREVDCFYKYGIFSVYGGKK